MDKYRPGSDVKSTPKGYLISTTLLFGVCDIGYNFPCDTVSSRVNEHEKMIWVTGEFFLVLKMH